jgi:serine/threonine protein kinase
MGTVYRARQLALDREIALKVLKTNRRQLADVQRFHREMRAYAQLKHASVVQVYDFGASESGVLFLAMELVDGESLEAVVKHDGRMDAPRAAHVGAQIAKALGAAHEAGLVHRDVKPENVMLCRQFGEPDFVKVVDFGLARAIADESSRPERDVTGSGMLVGTPYYAAPEQTRGEAVDGRADLYSLGVLLYRLIGGRLPIDPDGLAAVARVPADAALARVIAELIKSDPAARLQPASEVALRLAAIAAPMVAPRRRWAMAAAFAGAVLVAGVGALFVAPRLRAGGRDHAASSEPPISAQLPSSAQPPSNAMPAVGVFPPSKVAPPGPDGVSASTEVPRLFRNVPRHLLCPDGLEPFLGGSLKFPDREVLVKPFCLDRARVTGAAYATCASCPKMVNTRPGCTSSSADHRTFPLNCVYWRQASVYCAQHGKRLPSKDELTWLILLDQGGTLRDFTGEDWEWTSDPPAALDAPEFDRKQFMCGGQRGRRGVREPCFQWFAAARNDDVGFRCAWPP